MNTQRAINMLKVIQRHLRTHKEYESAEDVNLLIDYVSKIQSRLDAAVEEACHAAQADPNAPRSGMVLNNTRVPKRVWLVEDCYEAPGRILAIFKDEDDAIRFADTQTSASVTARTVQRGQPPIRGYNP